MTAEPADLDAPDPLPDPGYRALSGCAGTPITLAGGATWLLCDGGLLNDLDAVRDRLYDSCQLVGSVEMVDVMEAAVALLVANYDLTFRDAFRLLAGVDHQPLADAVLLALFGPQGDSRRTYTTWAAATLVANGIDPAAVPTALLPLVLETLVATRRAIPAGKWVESAEAGPRLAGLRSRAVRATPAPDPAEAP